MANKKQYVHKNTNRYLTSNKKYNIISPFYPFRGSAAVAQLTVALSRPYYKYIWEEKKGGILIVPPIW